MATQPFDPLRLLRALAAHGVRFVVIGGIAGRLHGSPTVTRDLDICYARDDANLEVLATALQQLRARLRGAADPLPFRLEARTLAAGDSFTLETDAGDFDLLGTPAGTSGYDELLRTAEEVDLEGLTVRVASIDALIQMKRAAGRRKDMIEVEILSAVRDELDRASG